MPTKVYTSVAKLDAPDGVLYAHTLGGGAHLSNAKLTTAKRERETDYDTTLTNFSYTVAGGGCGHSPKVSPGDKVRTIQQKVETDEGTIYLPIRPHNAYLTKREASAALRAAGGGKGGTRTNLVIYKFIVKE